MEITLEITQYCPNECDYCSSNASKDGKPIKYTKIVKFLESIEGSIDRINLSGGEPLSHPDFYKILEYCKTYTNNVWVYTNALTQIIYNADVIKELRVESNTVIIPGRECYIPKTVDRVHLLKLINQGRARDFIGPEVTVSRNFYDPLHCDDCQHILLQADGKVVNAPCRKEY